MRIVNRRHEPLTADMVYVGRPSHWGNPYVVGRDGTRAQVIARYRRWLWAQLQRDPGLLAPLVGRDLACWCAPLPCHAEVLAAAIAWRYGTTGTTDRPGHEGTA
jgi:hypothetical protein